MTQAKGTLPWYKRNPQRWLNATRELTLEQRGAYNDCLELLYLRDRRIPDDSRFVASFLGVTARKWNAIREVLLDHGHLVQAGDYLTDGWFERERAASIREREAQRSARVKGGKARAAQADRDRQGRFDLNEDENGGNPPVGTSSQLDDSSEVTVRGENIQGNQGSEPAASWSDLDDSFLGENDVSRDFREDFSEFSRDFRGSKKGENGSFPPPSSSSARGCERASEGREEDSYLPSYEEGGSGGKRTKRPHKLPADWVRPEPTEDCAAILAQWPPGMVERTERRFRDHAEATGRTMTNWNAAWRVWIGKANDDWERSNRQEQRRGGGNGWGGVAASIVR